MNLEINRKDQYCKDCMFLSDSPWAARELWDSIDCLLFKQELAVEGDYEDDGSCEYRAIACKQCNVMVSNCD